MAMALPRRCAMPESDRPSRSWPSKASRLAERRAPRASRFMTASAVTDLPQPDSPTRQWVSPRSTVSEAPRTAETRPPKLTSSCSTSSSALTDPGPRAEQVAQAVAQQVDAQHQHEQRHARDHDHPGAEEHVLLGLGDHQAPRRQRRRHAEAEEGERGLEQDGERDLERGHDDEVARDVGQHLARQDAKARAAGAPGGGDEVEVAHLHGGRARHHGEAVPQQQAERQHQQGHRAAEQADHRQRHQHDRDGQARGDGEQHGIVDPAAEEAAQHADGDADQRPRRRSP